MKYTIRLRLLIKTAISRAHYSGCSEPHVIEAYALAYIASEAGIHPDSLRRMLTKKKESP